MPNLVVAKPSFSLESQFLNMCEDYRNKGESAYSYQTLEEVREKIVSDQNHENGILPQGRLQSYSYWFLLDAELIGTSRIRPNLNDRFERVGGNVGYDVSPSNRRRGFGTEILKLTILEAISLGIKGLLLTCDNDNLGSIQVIERNKGVFLDVNFDAITGKDVRRYSFDLATTKEISS